MVTNPDNIVAIKKGTI